MTTRPLKLEDVDALLVRWDERLTTIDESLLALESDATYEMLTRGAALDQKLEGTSLERARLAVAAVAQLFEDRERLRGVLDRARDTRQKASTLAFWSRGAHLTELELLLLGPSVQLAVTQVPLSQRSLLGDATGTERTDLEGLVRRMTHTFERARDVLAQLSRAYNEHLPAIERAERDLTAMRGEAATLLPDARDGDIDACLEALDRARRALSRDPLGASPTTITAPLQASKSLRTKLDAAAAERALASSRVAQAREAVSIAAASARACREAVAEAQSRFALGPAIARLLAPTTEAARLEAWVTTLSQVADARRYRAAITSAERLVTEARRCAEDCARTADRARSLSHKAAELSGLVDARLAQLDARPDTMPQGSRELLSAARDLLALRPARLGDAARLTHEVEARISRSKTR